MPLIFRTMRHDDDGPLLGAEEDMLGATNRDVSVGEDGAVGPGRGISVAPEWRKLPPSRIPARLRDPWAPKARGGLDRCIWQLGEGAFLASEVAPGLRLVVTDPKRHGEVAPAELILLDAYQGHLAATKPKWSLIPEEKERGARQADGRK